MKFKLVKYFNFKMRQHSGNLNYNLNIQSRWTPHILFYKLVSSLLFSILHHPWILLYLIYFLSIYNFCSVTLTHFLSSLLCSLLIIWFLHNCHFLVPPVSIRPHAAPALISSSLHSYDFYYVQLTLLSWRWKLVVIFE